MTMKPAASEFTPAYVTNLFLANLLSTDEESLPVLSDDEEMLYHRVQACIEEKNKLSEFIPSPPTILMELLNELGNEDTDFNKIREIIAEDAGLIGEIVRIANSPLYLTRAGEITSLDKAVTLLGINGVLKVASTVMMRNLVDVENCQYKAQMKKLWSFCLQSGESCQLLGGAENSFRNYLLGMVHQIGSICIISILIANLKDSGNKNANEMLVLQRIIMERSAWLSSLIAAEWRMPEDYLLVLNEFTRLREGQIDEEDYEYCSPLTKNLQLGTLAAQCYVLQKSGRLGSEQVLEILQQAGIEAVLVNKLFTRLELASAELS